MIEEQLEKSHKIISLLKLEKNIFLERLGMIDKGIDKSEWVSFLQFEHVELDSSDTDEDIHNDFKWNSAKSFPKDDLNKSSPPPIQLQPPEIVVTDQQQQKKQKLDTPNQRNPPSSTAKSRQGKDLIEYDNEGNPILPIKIGVLTLHNLGVVNFTNPLYHTARHIFPIGFKTSRSYMSTVFPDKYSIYTSSIAEGEKGPIFQVVAEDKPDYIYKATSMTGVWTSVAKG